MKKSILLDKNLIQTYHQAHRLNLAQDFIRMLGKEIELISFSEISLKNPDILKCQGFWSAVQQSSHYVLLVTQPFNMLLNFQLKLGCPHLHESSVCSYTSLPLFIVTFYSFSFSNDLFTGANQPIRAMAINTP